MKIKDLCCDEQPREKMLRSGANSLSNAELLAILMRTGDGSRNAVEICRDLMKQAGEDLCVLSDWSVDKLQEINGIGPAKALTVAACFELARRWFTSKSTNISTSLRTPRDIHKLMGPKLRSIGHEESWAIFLNRAFSPVGMEMLSTGGLTQTVFDVRAIVRMALEKKATAVILVHNHPSGDPRPGASDVKSTASLRAALEAFDIPLLDHVIISDGSWYSFADERVYPSDVPAHVGTRDA